jgi:hypothetical protein
MEKHMGRCPLIIKGIIQNKRRSLYFKKKILQIAVVTITLIVLEPPYNSIAPLLKRSETPNFHKPNQVRSIYPLSGEKAQRKASSFMLWL